MKLHGILTVALTASLVGMLLASCRPAPPTPPESAPANPIAKLADPEPPAAQAAIRFSGSFTERADTRKVEALCPACNKRVAPGLLACPLCSARIGWPEKVKCGFCSEDRAGACGICGASGQCPSCAKGPRMLMGIKPPCDLCSNSGKCPACGGTAKCTFCDNGWYRPGVSRQSVPPSP